MGMGMNVADSLGGFVQAKYVLVKKYTDLVEVLVNVLIETMLSYRCI